MKFPREINKAMGWTIEYSFLNHVKALVEKEHYFHSVSMEVIEDILLAVEYLTSEDQDDGL